MYKEYLGEGKKQTCWNINVPYAFIMLQTLKTTKKIKVIEIVIVMISIIKQWTSIGTNMQSLNTKTKECIFPLHFQLGDIIKQGFWDF